MKTQGIPMTAERYRDFTAAELKGHRISISNPNTRTWNTLLVDVDTGYKIANATAITLHGSMRRGREVDQLTAIITLLHIDPHRRDHDLFAETIWDEEVEVEVHSIVTLAHVGHTCPCCGKPEEEQGV
jgi:hypothetical protein